MDLKSDIKIKILNGQVLIFFKKWQIANGKSFVVPLIIWFQNFIKIRLIVTEILIKV